MEDDRENKLLIYLKRHPHVVDRYVKENCTMVQLKEWITSIGKRSTDQEMQTAAKVGQNAIPGEERRASLIISSAMSKTTLLGSTRKEMIYSDMTTSIRSCVSVDGTNLYLREPESEFIYFQPANEPIRCAQGSPDLFKIDADEILACYAARTKYPILSTNIPEDVEIKRLSILPAPLVKHVLCVPIIHAQDTCVGVIELYRAPNKPPFAATDKLLAYQFVYWMQLVLESNEKLLASEKAQVLGDFILEVIRNLFSRIKNVDSVIRAIMEHAKELVNAERVTLYLLDAKKQELYSSIMDHCDFISPKLRQVVETETRFSISQGFAGYVARTGEVVRLTDVKKDQRYCPEMYESQNFATRSILAIPLSDGEGIVGVIEMMNKHSGQFTQEDESFLKIYSIYCCLAINVARMYDRIYRSDRKYRVALEVLTYHSCVTESEFENALPCDIPEVIPNIECFDYSPWDVEEHKELSTVMYMVFDLAGKLIIEKTTLIRFVMTVRKNYRPVSYHNWDHGFSVAHSMYYLLKSGDHRFTLSEKVCMFIAALCHDLDHRGFDNRFMKKFSTPLASLYSSSPMEHHHFNMTITILQQRNHNLFGHFKNISYRNILGIIKHAILATDLATFWTSKAKLEQVLDSPNGIDWTDQGQRMTVVSIAMPTCDLCAMYKPWDIQVKVVMLIMEEFWAQGDQEKKSDSKPLSLMDRDEAVQLADGQVGFIRGICLPCYSTMVRAFPGISIIVDTVKQNLSRWEYIAKLPYEERERILSEQMQERFSKIEGRNKA